MDCYDIRYSSDAAFRRLARMECARCGTLAFKIVWAEWQRYRCTVCGLEWHDDVALPSI